MDSDDRVLADAADVAEVVVSDECDNQLDEFDSQSLLANCCLEGASSSGELFSINQIHNVSSVSNVGNNSKVITVGIDNLPIPSNCCLEGVSSSGELSTVSKICIVSNVDNYNNVNDSVSKDNVRNVNYYDSSLESSHPLDSEMSQASDPRKHPIEDVPLMMLLRIFLPDLLLCPPWLLSVGPRSVDLPREALKPPASMCLLV